MEASIEQGQPPEEMPAVQRQDVLNKRIAQWAQKGWRVESQTEASATLVKGHRPNHILHLILSIITAGLWAIFVWLPIAIFGGENRRVISVDPYGQISG